MALWRTCTLIGTVYKDLTQRTAVRPGQIELAQAGFVLGQVAEFEQHEPLDRALAGKDHRLKRERRKRYPQPVFRQKAQPAGVANLIRPGKRQAQSGSFLRVSDNREQRETQKRGPYHVIARASAILTLRPGALSSDRLLR